MTLLPPVLLVFDSNAILAGRSPDWRGFTRIGDCLIPKVVMDDVEFSSTYAPEQSVEAIAKEFLRFYPNGGWQQTLVTASHPKLKPAEGHTLSKRARLALGLMQTAYGLAKRRPEALVVLVSNDQSVLHQLSQLDMPNLCGLTLAAMQQWNRTQRRPPIVTNHLQTLRTPVEAGVTATSQPTPYRSTLRSASGMTPAEQRWRAQRKRPVRLGWLKSLVYNLIGVAILAIALAAVWRVVHPSSFNQFWRQLPISIKVLNPSLPTSK